MSTILQPCFESQFIEQPSSTVTLKLSPPTNDHSGLSFQQILSNISSNTPTETKHQTVYVHPMSRQSSSSSSSSRRLLNEKSFEMCTENLGSETGTDDIIDSSIFSLSSASNYYNSSSPREKSKSSREYSKNCRNFPPPLTTISGGNSIQVRPHREDGRLVIKAIETPSKRTYLRAERSNGRLVLCLLEDNNKFESHQENDEVENDQEQVLAEEEEENDQEFEKEEEENDQEFEEEEEDIDEEEMMMMMMMIRKEDMDGNNFEIEVEMGNMENFNQRLTRRCNQGGGGGHNNKGLYNWEPLWVATS
ncbi:hypothetical protein M9H77_36572 [Catharanthus roseus]|uniref:Uncharacterized protein n=1 Tax=Catharanthus roseus TaxID=4058 RepID=A0ACB9ZWG3_CATRO|nr:hypothetical protein M9H77_36572 [Catharanthus roseus]